jgi:hypothetical protein
VELATRAHAVIGNFVEIDGRRYRVTRNHYDLRFHGQSRFAGDNPPYAIVDVLRDDLARAATLPCGFPDRVLAAECEQIVSAALASIRPRIIYFVYADTSGAVLEGERATLHNARRLAQSLQRQGFGTCIRSTRVRADGSQVGEFVEAALASGQAVA